MVGCAPIDHVSGSPSASVASTCTIVESVLGRRDRSARRSPAPSCRAAGRRRARPGFPARGVRERDDGRGQRAERVSPGRDAELRPSGGCPAMGRRLGRACTITGLPQASVVAPGSGGAAEAVVALTTPGARRDPRGRRRRPARRRSRRAAERSGCRRRPGRSAAAGPNVAPPSSDIAANARTARPDAFACQATVTRPPAATTLGAGAPAMPLTTAGDVRVAHDGARPDEAGRAAVVAARRRRRVGTGLGLDLRARLVAERDDHAAVRQHGQRGAPVVGGAGRGERRDAPRAGPTSPRRCRSRSGRSASCRACRAVRVREVEPWCRRRTRDRS